MSCCIKNPKFIGCFPTCGTDALINLGVNAAMTGTYSFVFEAGGYRLNKAVEMTDGQPLTVSTEKLNESMSYQLTVTDPNGAAVVSGDWDGWVVKTVFNNYVLS